ncbi:hypothetical protein X798_02669 [Onchocerca flexuosa]|uniref:Uncharacterized protein n=2 Tax=Onchocerca flexuosa TaxID=387005 RepID=A0A183I024_9BILA|nr:hypothetical protein X798_02669 [Onchocerca flexuosa]VDP12898.1 unnamed protein product [Onchocerca flexuosa]
MYIFTNTLRIRKSEKQSDTNWHYLGSTAVGKEGNEINYLWQSRNGRRLRREGTWEKELREFKGSQLVVDWFEAILLSRRMFRSGFPVPSLPLHLSQVSHQ